MIIFCELPIDITPSSLISTAPTISTSLPRIVNVELGKSLEITCSASGRPLPEVMWLIDDIPVSSKVS